MFSIRFAFLASISIITLLGGCLSQDFERQSLAKYRTSNASTFVGFDPISHLDSTSKKVAPQVNRQGGRIFPGRFTQPGGGRFTAPRGGFTFPGGNRLTIPGGFTGKGGQFSSPSGNFSWPGGDPKQSNNARFTWPNPLSEHGGTRLTWPRGNPRNGLTQPNSRLTWPRENSGRFTLPLK